MRVLIVDDEPTICHLIAEKLKPLGFDVHTAPDGEKGLRRVGELKPDILILDVNMPRMNGFEVLERLRRDEKESRSYVLMLTARSGKDDLEQGLEHGADDYLTKPFELRELAARIKAAARIQSLQQELRTANTQLTKTNSALERTLKEKEQLNARMLQELEIAARLQGSLLSPAKMELGRCLVSTRYKPSSKIGGDFYDIRRVGQESACILLADAVGHGVSAALLAAMLKMAWEESLQPETNPAAVLSSLNRKFQFCSDRGEFISAFLGVLESETGQMIYSLAGHVPPLLCRFSDHEIQELNSPGYCLGIFEDGQYEDREVRLQPGDRLLVFTDGLSEASREDDEQFGTRLPELLQVTTHLPNEQFLDQLTAGLTSFLGLQQPSDDYTLLSIHFRDSNDQAPAHRPQGLQGNDHS